MSSTLIAVRVPGPMVADLRRCPGLDEVFKVVAVGQSEEDDIRDWVDTTNPQQEHNTATLYEALAKATLCTHAIVAQPLHWYSVTAADALRRSGVRVFWLEAFYDRAVLDEVGCHYTCDNEIQRYWKDVPTRRLPEGVVTRYKQPPQASVVELHARYGAFCVPIFGQCPDDMALREYGLGLSYANWLAVLLEMNPGVRFLFKHHPHERTELPRGAGDEVLEVDEHVHSLIDAYPICASYSSHCIYEGVRRGRTFVTGGFHYLSGLVRRICARSEARIHRAGARPWTPAREAAIAQRLSFVENAYALWLHEPDALRRLLWNPHELLVYYQQRAERAPAVEVE